MSELRVIQGGNEPTDPAERARRMHPSAITKRCETCHGQGHVIIYGRRNPITCGECEGDGRVMTPEHEQRIDELVSQMMMLEAFGRSYEPQLAALQAELEALNNEALRRLAGRRWPVD